MKNLKNLRVNIIMMMFLAVCVSMICFSCSDDETTPTTSIKGKDKISFVYYANQVGDNALVTSAEWKEDSKDLLFGCYLPDRGIIVANNSGKVAGLDYVRWKPDKQFAESCTLDGKALTSPSKDTFKGWSDKDKSAIDRYFAFLAEKQISADGNVGPCWLAEEADYNHGNAFVFATGKVGASSKGNMLNNVTRVVFAVK